MYPDTEREDSFYEGCEKMGNVFASKEEAEKAKKKLEALKRLKAAGFRFECWDYDDNDRLKCMHTGKILFSVGKGEGIVKDLGLLFSEDNQ